MTIFLTILSCLLFAGALATLPKYILLSPALSYCGMLLLTFCKNSIGDAIFPLTTSLLVSWLCITLVVMLIIVMQPAEIRQQSRGVFYMAVGALAGMMLGLAFVNLMSTMQMAYALMVLGTAVGIFLGLLVFAGTPRGTNIRTGSGYFFKYLAAKGFPILVTMAQGGIILTVLLF